MILTRLMTEHAVDPVADHQGVLVGLDVNVGGPLPDRLHDEIVDELDDAGFLGLLQLVGFGSREIRFQRRLGVTCQLVEGVAGHAVVRADELADVPLVRQHQLDGHTGQQTELIEGGQLEGIAGGDAQRTVLAPNRHASLLEHELRWQQLQHVLFDVDRVEVHNRQRELLADHLQHVGSGDEPQTHHHVVEPLARAILLVDRLVELRLVD
jgi:hypothetical protein